MPLQHSDNEDHNPRPRRSTTADDTTASLSLRQQELERESDRRHADFKNTIDELRAAQTELTHLVKQLAKRLESGASYAEDPKRTNPVLPKREVTAEPTSLPPIDSQLPQDRKMFAGTRRRLEKLTYYPESKPAEFVSWVDDLRQFRDYYQLSDKQAISELQWYGGFRIKERVGLIQRAENDIPFDHLCDQLIQAALPAGAAQDARRQFRSCRQLERESGTSFLRRFDEALREYRRFAAVADEDVYQDLLSQLNHKYVAELRTDTDERGPLTMIELPAARLLATHAAIRKIESAKGMSEKSMQELTSGRPNRSDIPATSRSINNVSSWAQSDSNAECRSCNKANRPSNHDYRSCVHALQRAYCRACKEKGHFRTQTCPDKATPMLAITARSSYTDLADKAEVTSD